MSNHINPFEIFSGIILQKNKIAEHSYHIKIQSPDFSRMQYLAGFTVDIFLSNPYYNPHSECRKYSFWNYEPVYQIADFAINTFSNGKGAQWVKSLQEGDTIFYKKPTAQLLIDNSGDHYFLIGDVTALAHLYEINRALTVSKQVSSFIYAAQDEDFYPDLDHSFPLKTFTINTFHADIIIALIVLHFPKYTRNTIAYIVGDSKTSIAIYNFLKDHPFYDMKFIYIKSFWKN